MKHTNNTTFSDVHINSLFIVEDCGVLKKTSHITATTKEGKEHVVYPNEPVRLLKKRSKQ